MTLHRKPAAAYCFVMLLLLSACTKKDIEFGNEMGETYTNVIQVDTVGINMSTFVIDSFPTNSIASFIIGNYRDSLLGTVKAKAFIQLMPTLGITLEDDAVYDSLSFVIKPNDYYYGDTTHSQTITINELAASLEYRYSTYIYNTSSFAEKSSPLGSRTMQVNPVKDDSIVVRLDQAKGLELFTKIKQAAAEMQTSDEFLNYFKGVSISSSSTSPSAVIGLTKASDSIYMRLHYHTTIPYLEAKHIDFTFHNNLYSNQVVTDRSGTALASVINEEISSSLTGNRTFTQAGAGVLLKMTFPTLRNVLQLEPTVRLLKASLVLTVPSNSYDGKLPLPASLWFAQTDEANALGSVIYNAAGDNVLSASPTFDNLYDGATTYSFDLTSFFNSLLTTAGSENTGLFLMGDSPGSTGSVNRAVINDALSSKNGSRLVLSLLTLKNQ